MIEEPVVVYVATYPSADRAADDLACLERLQRDGIIAPADSTVVARDTEGWVVRRATRNSDDAVAVGMHAVDWVLGLLFPPPLRGSAAWDWSDEPDAAPTWMHEDEVRELRESLAYADAAVVVVGAVGLAPPVRVALARSTSMLDVNLTPEGAHLVRELPTTIGMGA